jgi:hypothetical protein
MAVPGGYGQRLISLLDTEQVTEAEVIGQCQLKGGLEESVSITLADGTELYVQAQGWAPERDPEQAVDNEPECPCWPDCLEVRQ